MPIPRPPAPGRHLRVTRRLALLAAGVAASLVVASVALAFWAGEGQGTGTARAAIFDLAGAKPTVRVKGHDVSLSWTQDRLSGQRLGSLSSGGYLVRRYDAGGRSQEIRTACMGRTAGSGRVVRCIDRAVPDGTWQYSVTPVLGGWTGMEGPRVTVTIGPAAAVAVTTPRDGSATRDPRPAIAGTTRSGPGDPQQVTVAVSKGRDLEGVVHRRTAVVRDGAWSVRLTMPLPEGVYTVRAGRADPDGHTAWSTPSTFLVDTTEPSTGEGTRQLGDGWHRTSQTVTLSPADPGGSGVAATYFTTDGSTPSTGSRHGTRVRFDADGVHLLRVFSVDRAGNAEAVRTFGRVRIDRTAPDTVELDPLPDLVVDGQPLAASGDDALSGVAEVVYEYCPEEACDAWAPIGSDAAAPAHPVAWHRQPADGTYRVRARMLDKAGNATASDPRVVRVDNTPPEVTEVTGGDGDGKVEAGDDLVVSFSERLDPDSLPPAGRLTFGRTMAAETTIRLPGVTEGPVSTGTRAWVRRGSSLTYEGTLALEGDDHRLRFTVTRCAAGCRRASAGWPGTLRFVPAGSLHDVAGHPASGSSSATRTLF